MKTLFIIYVVVCLLLAVGMAVGIIRHKGNDGGPAPWFKSMILIFLWPLVAVLVILLLIFDRKIDQW